MNRNRGEEMIENHMFQKKIIDITAQLHEGTIKYEKLEGFKKEWIRRIGDEDNNQLNMSRFSLNSHVGTHVDAPLHFIRDGKSIDERPIQDLMGKAQIIEVPYPETVTAEFLEKQFKGVKIALFKFGKERLNREHDYFDESAINYLYERKVTAIGTDNFTPDSKGTKYNVHYWVLGKEMWIIEVLNLENVEPGVYDFICLPINVVGVEAASARAILFTE